MSTQAETPSAGHDPFNLIHEAWIPVRRESGARCWIAPHQLTEKLREDPIVRVATGRPDFDGALTEFLIGLAQVALLPGSDSDWAAALESPPEPEALRARLEPWAPGFNLLGDGPRFMQDLEPLDGSPRDANPLKELLVEVPAGNTLKLNKDHFVKRDDAIEGLSLPAAAAALMMLQTYAPSGGAGHRTSLRGGGPLTTLLLGESLWQTVWLNVLTVEQYRLLHKNIDLPTPTPELVLPWMQPTRTSEKGSRTLTTGPGDVHPMQALWGMPRRLTLGGASAGGDCMIYGASAPDGARELIAEYWTRPSGNNYDAYWQHPLSPYSRDVKSDSHELNAQKGNPGSLQYRNWKRWAVQDDAQGQLIARPIFVMSQSNARRRALRTQRIRPGLWLFGYDFDNAKLRRWYDGRAPLFLIEPEQQERFAAEVVRCVEAAEHAVKALRDAVKRGLFGKLKGKKWDLRPTLNTKALLFANVTERFWEGSSGAFYELLDRIASTLEDPTLDGVGRLDALVALCEGWAKDLKQHALSIYDDVSPAHTALARDVKAAVRARAELAMFTSPGAKKVREILALGPR